MVVSFGLFVLFLICGFVWCGLMCIVFVVLVWCYVRFWFLVLCCLLFAV